MKRSELEFLPFPLSVSVKVKLSDHADTGIILNDIDGDLTRRKFTLERKLGSIFFETGVLFFSFIFRTHDAGLVEIVETESGRQLRCRIQNVMDLWLLSLIALMAEFGLSVGSAFGKLVIILGLPLLMQLNRTIWILGWLQTIAKRWKRVS